MASPVDLPPKKKTKLTHADDDEPAAVAIHQLEDIMAIILGWLGVEDVMRSRRVCKKWKEAARKTIVPLCKFSVHSVENYNAMRVMATEMPNLQQIEICALGGGHKYVDGEDPDEEGAARFYHADMTAHEIEIISNFKKLQVLQIHSYSYMSFNGRYPNLFNFPLLKKLSIKYCRYLKWDLDMLAGLPSLKELSCRESPCLTGNINSLRVLKDTLELVQIRWCDNVVEGNFMDLADFPHLKLLDIEDTAVTGDIRDIGENDFQALETLFLPNGVFGANNYKLQRISDAPDLMSAVYLLKTQRPVLVDIDNWYGWLSDDSPDWYRSTDDYFRPPFCIWFVQVGPRIGYQWATHLRAYHLHLQHFCEINWLDPEADRESSNHGQYIEELIDYKARFYRGFHQPPSEEEYNRLVEEARGFD
jgi:hypothetical protein